MRPTTLLGVAIDFTPIDPFKALYWSAILNGIIALPIMAVMMRMAGRPDIMGSLVIGPRLRWLGWFATILMAAAVAALLVSMADVKRRQRPNGIERRRWNRQRQASSPLAA